MRCSVDGGFDGWQKNSNRRHSRQKSGNLAFFRSCSNVLPSTAQGARFGAVQEMPHTKEPTMRFAYFPIVALALFASNSLAQETDLGFGVVDGAVNLASVSGTTLYVGGNFSLVGPPTGGCA